jgi:phosphoribosyl 1,2-cyclic phosphodiesterase
MLSVRFWGVRGSISCPGRDTVVYGGNTSCLEIRAGERLLIVDLGTGVRPLGDFLRANDLNKYGKIEADVFVTHTHWDHIMGFPLFAPIYMPGTVLRIYGPPSSENDSLESIIKLQLSYRYWPVRVEDLSANIKFKQIKEATLDLGDGLTVTSKILNHPGVCLGYRFNYEGKSIAAVFDHEPFHKLLKTDPFNPGFNDKTAKKSNVNVEEENGKILSFIQDADIVVHDTQYTDEEYKTHIGWGHASYEYAVEFATNAKAKKVVFYHYDPVNTDKQLKKIEKYYARKAKIKTLMAKEGMILQA